MFESHEVIHKSTPQFDLDTKDFKEKQKQTKQKTRKFSTRDSQWIKLNIYL